MEKHAVEIANEMIKAKYGDKAPVIGGVTRSPLFKGTEQELAEELFEQFEEQWNKSPQEKADQQWETIYDMLKDATHELQYDLRKEYTYEDLTKKISNAFCDLDFALLHLSYFMPSHIRKGYKERSEAKKKAQEELEELMDGVTVVPGDFSSLLGLLKDSESDINKELES
jgi:hypothetical protein